MLIPLVLALARGERWTAFGVGAAVSFLFGALLATWCRCKLQSGLNLRQAFLLTPVSWLTIAIVGAIPFYYSNFGIVSGSVTNAFFESMSGLTTTGSTVITKLDQAPAGLLLWRALLQWIGGIGIIAVAIAVLPALGIGGMQLFRTESSDRSEKAMPRVRQIATGIGLVYLSLTILAGLSYWAAGMTPFEAVAHALTTISTGGYSTSDNSLGNWTDNGIQWIAALFMLSGGIPFVLYVRFLAGERHALWARQVKTLLGFLAAIITGLTAWLALSGEYQLLDAARFATFNTISVVTTTGY
ncbi:MAG: TrkH family potassium uptake protein, partial [Gemmatimonadaceae bacterium]|nr:TrkH family potassium uptake protein [Gemmatimonadaceae bacterium]